MTDGQCRSDGHIGTPIVLLRCDLILEMVSGKRIEPDQEQTYSVYAKSDANDLDDRDFSP